MKQIADADPANGENPLFRAAQAYLDFARAHPAVYDAMFTRATALHFAAEDTPPELKSAFAELRQAVGLVAGARDTDALTEVFWAALHGPVPLHRAGRLRPGHEAQRLQLLVEQLSREQSS